MCVWAYTLMPNHVHLIVVPRREESLRLGIGEAHRRYAVTLNSREGWQGHFWQARFYSCVMDERHVRNGARYILRNPVRAGLVKKAGDWPHSSAKAHIRGRGDDLVDVAPLARRVLDWRAFLAEDVDSEEVERLRRHFRSEWPLGSERFLDTLEKQVGRPVRPGRRGRKPRTRNSE